MKKTLSAFLAGLALAVALPVLRHRILVNFQAEADGITAEQVVGELLDSVQPA